MPLQPTRNIPPPPAPRRRSRLRWAIVALVVLVVGAFVIRPFWQLTSQFDDITYRQPSRLYAKATRLVPGRSYPAELLVSDLRAEGYREDTDSNPLPAGRYRKVGRGLAVHLRSFLRPDGSTGGGLVEIAYRGTRIATLRQDGHKADSVVLDPPLLASYYGPDQKERRPVTVDQVSEDLVSAVIAAEDDNFYDHSGVSFSGIARAVWVNLRGGKLRQGGSTLTQQLVKNIYLTHERTFGRKAQELVLAVLLEVRYDKRQILEAYLNEIYLGGSGGVSLMGVGAASRAYFGKDASQLDLAEAATLAGMIHAPALSSPLAHPDQAKERRDWVLERMARLKLADPERVQKAIASPVAVAPEPVVRRRAPYFADAIALEAQRRFGVEDLADGGYVLFSSLDWRNQQAAYDAVSEGLKKVEKGYQKGYKGKGPLQAALVSVDPETGGILAYVGGRSYEESQFDRAGQALRQSGSAFKPIIYAAAFEAHKVTPASFLEDEPLTVRLATVNWSPKNDDGTFHGWVTVRTALEKSYNPATTRLAMAVGMPRIIELAHDMGITSKMEPYPSVALGSAEVTPAELASVYATLAAGGVRPPVHGLAAVLDRYGKPVEGAPLPKPKRVLSTQSTYLVTSLLQGVFERGTARGAAAGIPGDVAGKTGTTNKRRDSWFGGYSPQRATVVWVGYDDNSSTRLSGARAALPLWVRFTAKVSRSGVTFPQPSGVTTAVIDPSTGLLATEFCPYVITEVFREGEAPSELCNRHSSYFDTQFAEASDEGYGEDDAMVDVGGAEAGDEAAAVVTEDRGERKRHPIRRWFKKVFGGSSGGSGRDERSGDGKKEGDGPPPPG
ncbi:MAG TPA: PBP1A family penicillin-binding protein [Thermoanaerobaculia bacterium]|nr:PBP1A family penicillin-binding protein [Thermoanaerobaculia bacterium]